MNPSLEQTREMIPDLDRNRDPHDHRKKPRVARYYARLCPCHHPSGPHRFDPDLDCDDCGIPFWTFQANEKDRILWGDEFNGDMRTTRCKAQRTYAGKGAGAQKEKKRSAPGLR